MADLSDGLGILSWPHDAFDDDENGNSAAWVVRLSMRQLHPSHSRETQSQYIDGTSFLPELKEDTVIKLASNILLD